MNPLVILLAASSFALGGCVTYTYGGKKYDTQEQVVEAMKENTRQLLSEITPLPKPVTNKTLTYIAPGYNAFMAAQEQIDKLAGVTRNEVQRGNAEIKAKEREANSEFSAAMIKKRNLFKNVIFVPSSSYTNPEPVISDEEDALYVSCSYSEDGKNAACETYYVSKKYGKQVFVVDRGSPDYKKRNKAFLQAVEALAIRE